MKFTPGHRYMTKNGQMWYCLASGAEHVYLQARPGSPAYVWKLDGTCVSLYEAGAGYDLILGYSEEPTPRPN